MRNLCRLLQSWNYLFTGSVILPVGFLFVAFFFIPLEKANCQELIRKGWLGINFYKQIPDTLKAFYQVEGRSGVLVKTVYPGSTASALEMQAGDYVLAINKTFTPTADSLLSLIKGFQPGDKISVSIYRKGKGKVLRGTYLAKPLETGVAEEVIYDEVNFKEGTLRAIIKKPKGNLKYPVVYFIQGYPCSSIDYFLGERNSYSQLIDGLVDKGYVVFTVEKAGMGDSRGVKHCNQIGYYE